ncbi:hypothetical protein O181_060863 [Austropuccinia psidii MF-1]|uniref:Integrase catalytic domain-containing protein n=1 Tax=Austropuccinia psidii MF-1 TaxID=1389203 RepID=A0A9Q3EH56_9BASI|nr:hypothetical protein [Austropuccinia psidii MF-1]
MYINYTLPKAHIMVNNNNFWHKRLCHPGIAVLKNLGLPTSNIICNFCELNQVCNQPFNETFKDALLPLDCLHIKLVGPIHPSYFSRSQYFLSITDHATSYKIAKFLGRKLDAFEEFLMAKTFLQNQKDLKIKKLISDQGGEFLIKRFEHISREHAFDHIFSPPETPQHNGFAKRSNRTILDKSRCLLCSCNLYAEYWAEAVNTAVLLSNMNPMQ